MGRKKKKTLLSPEKGVKCSYYTFFTYVGHACNTMRLFVTFGGRIGSDDGDGGLLSPSFYSDSACKLQVAFWGGERISASGRPSHISHHGISRYGNTTLAASSGESSIVLFIINSLERATSVLAPKKNNRQTRRHAMLCGP